VTIDTKKSNMDKMLEANKARTEIAGEVNTNWSPDAIKLYADWVVKIKKMSPHLKEKQIELLAEVATEANLKNSK
jgi:hypothetical protein|tara:strand:+ start:249 stop:473 length:225 start_codon:yes stop_codon:yes gene_type:complete